MGNREDLLAGAKRCLYEKGYARTTARDIATAAGTSLAAIGYHFRSTEALLNAALIEAVQEWGEEVGRALAADGPADPGAGMLDRFEAAWERVIESFSTHRAMWTTQLELLVQLDHLPEMRRQLAPAMQSARAGLAKLFLNIDPAADEKKAQMVGSFYQALLSGVLNQWLVDPEHAPSSRDLATALRIIAGEIGSGDEGAHEPSPARRGAE
jgi:AcrR family transcriptional regulator